MELRDILFVAHRDTFCGSAFEIHSKEYYRHTQVWFDRSFESECGFFKGGG